MAPCVRVTIVAHVCVCLTTYAAVCMAACVRVCMAVHVCVCKAACTSACMVVHPCMCVAVHVSMALSSVHVYVGMIPSQTIALRHGWRNSGLAYAYLAREGGATCGGCIAIVSCIHPLSLCVVIAVVSHRVHKLHEHFCISALYAFWLGW